MNIQVTGNIGDSGSINAVDAFFCGGIANAV